MNNPCVSVVIPTFGRARLLGEAIQSVAKQQIKPFEVIVVDNNPAGSMEQQESRGIVQSFDQALNIIYLHQATQGANHARNLGVQHARGQWIAFLDDDDYWMPEKLALQLPHTDRWQAILTNGIHSSTGKPIVSDKHFSVNAVILRENRPVGATLSSLLIDTALMRIHLFDTSLPKSQDWDLFIRLIASTPIGFVHTPLVKMRFDEDRQRISNIIRGKSISEIETDYLPFLEKHRSFFGETWFNRHLAALVLAYIGSKNDKRAFLMYAIRKAGLSATARVLLRKLAEELRK